MLEIAKKSNLWSQSEPGTLPQREERKKGGRSASCCHNRRRRPTNTVTKKQMKTPSRSCAGVSLLRGTGREGGGSTNGGAEDDQPKRATYQPRSLLRKRKGKKEGEGRPPAGPPSSLTTK